MYERETAVTNKTGLHAKPAADFTLHATRFVSEITLKNLDNGKTGDAKSIISVMAMEISKGTRIAIRADGDDETAAVDKLVSLVEAGMGEEE